jgi:enterochelin esterase-like enzyme
MSYKSSPGSIFFVHEFLPTVLLYRYCERTQSVFTTRPKTQDSELRRTSKHDLAPDSVMSVNVTPEVGNQTKSTTSSPYISRNTLKHRTSTSAVGVPYHQSPASQRQVVIALPPNTHTYISPQND